MRRRRALVVCAAVCLLTCQTNREGAPARRGEGGRGPSIPRVSKVRPLVLRLASQDEKQVKAARAELRSWEGAKALSASAAIELLRASAGVFPTDDEDDIEGGIGTEIIDVVAETPRPEYRPVIEEIFPRLRGPARNAAVNLLSAIDDPAAAESFVRLLRAHAPEMSELFSLEQLRDHPHHVDVFFPALLDLTWQPAIADEAYLTALEFCDKGLLTKDKMALRARSLLAAYRTERDWLVPRQRPRGVGWMWTDDYQAHRHTASFLLDLAACLPLSEVESNLTFALLSFRDPRLMYFALTSLLAHGRPLSPAAIATVAASAETRDLLFDKLKEKDLAELIPARYRTQAALAESNMVAWLAYPTELGRVPDQIELKKVVAVDTDSDDGILDYYLFRFKTLPPHWAAKKGWIAGVAGPFVRKDGPNTDANGGTFSEFERWDARTPDEHLGSIRELLDDWRKRRKESSSSDDE